MDFEVLVVGGGIQGVGLLHDLASRRIDGLCLVEKNRLASGTSSRSTKLLHGGLRYLERLGQWGLVQEALTERGLLLKILKDMAKPLPFVLPNFVDSGRPNWMIRFGLFAYDFLAGDAGVPRSRKLTQEELFQLAPYLKKERVEENFKGAFLYYDVQMLDDVIVRIVAKASENLGAHILEQTSVVSVKRRAAGGFTVVLEGEDGQQTVTARAVVNTGGPWCNANLIKWGVQPRVTTLLNTGSHMVFSKNILQSEPSQCAASLIQNHDGRAVFFIPWNDSWLFGTTESILQGAPDKLAVSQEDRDYLIQAAQKNLSLREPEKNILETFCGVRTMPLKMKKSPKDAPQDWQHDPYNSPWYKKTLDESISGLSRETVFDEPVTNLYCIYGGKYTTYRAASEALGSRISRDLGVGTISTTHSPEAWMLDKILKENPDISKTESSIRQI